MRTIVYIDGFNFYYACFTHQRYEDDGTVRRPDPLFARLQRAKWADLRLLMERRFPDRDIAGVHYFTARVSGTTADQAKPVRQQTYLRALEATGVEVHLGQFQTRTKPGRLRTPIDCRLLNFCVPVAVEVAVREEKGSDVFLASMLVRDAFTDRFDSAVVVSNDSDLVPAVRMVTEEAGKHVIVLSPYRRVSAELGAVATEIVALDREMILACQLPDQVIVRSGRVLRKPIGW